MKDEPEQEEPKYWEEPPGPDPDEAYDRRREEKAIAALEATEEVQRAVEMLKARTKRLEQPEIEFDDEHGCVIITMPKMFMPAGEPPWVGMSFDEFEDWARAMIQEIRNRRCRSGRASPEVGLHVSACPGASPGAVIEPGAEDKPGSEVKEWKRKPKK